MAEDADTTEQRLKKLVPPGQNIQVDQNSPFDPAAPAAPGGRQRVWPGNPTTPEQAGFNPAGLTPQDRAQPTPSTGGTQAGVGGQWSSFLDHPENRAGLMQFAVNMLAGKGLGESIGSAAEATGRNVAYQQEQSRYEEAQALKEQEAARKERETTYYGIAASKQGGAEERYFNRLDAQEAARARAQVGTDYLKWKQEISPDAIWGQVQDRFPELKGKSKKDMKPEHEAYARGLIAQGLGYGGPMERGAGAATQRGAPAPAGAPPRPKGAPANAQLMNVNGRPVWYDPKTQRPVPGQ